MLSLAWTVRDAKRFTSTMPHRGKRSKLSQERRDKYKLLLACSFHDRERAETISTVTMTIPTVKHEYFCGRDYCYIDPVEFQRGEVLVDSVGRGSCQRMGLKEETT